MHITQLESTITPEPKVNTFKESTFKRTKTQELTDHYLVGQTIPKVPEIKPTSQIEVPANVREYVSFTKEGFLVFKISTNNPDINSNFYIEVFRLSKFYPTLKIGSEVPKGVDYPTEVTVKSTDPKIQQAFVDELYQIVKDINEGKIIPKKFEQTIKQTSTKTVEIDLSKFQNPSEIMQSFKLSPKFRFDRVEVKADKNGNPNKVIFTIDSGVSIYGFVLKLREFSTIEQYQNFLRSNNPAPIQTPSIQPNKQPRVR